jgi:hypothetical protein
VAVSYAALLRVVLSPLTRNAVNIYHSYHNQNVTTGGKAVLFVSDIYGVPLLENKL